MAPLALHSRVTETTATVAVRSLSAPLRVLHLSDSHISLRSDRQPNSERMHNAFVGRPRRDTGEMALPRDIFRGQVQAAAENGTGLIIHTGDFLNFPSAESVAFATDVLEGCGLPWLYSSGNHDWHYEGLPGSSEALRDEWRARALLPLYGGRDPSRWVEDHDASGLRFIAIDNSTYQISPEQLDFPRAQHGAANRPPGAHPTLPGRPHGRDVRGRWHAPLRAGRVVVWRPPLGA
jgi:hypothetical protein